MYAPEEKEYLAKKGMSPTGSGKKMGPIEETDREYSIPASPLNSEGPALHEYFDPSKGIADSKFTTHFTMSER